MPHDHAVPGRIYRDFSRELRELFGVVGEGTSPEMLRTDAGVFCMVDLHALIREDVEDSPVRKAIGFQSQTPGFGQVAGVQLFNPAVTGIKLLVESAIVVTSGATEITIRESTGALTADGFLKDWRDDTLVPAQPLGLIRHQTSASPAGALVGTFHATPSGSFQPLDFVLARGNGVALFASTVDIEIKVTFSWSEQDAVEVP